MILSWPFPCWLLRYVCWGPPKENSGVLAPLNQTTNGSLCFYGLPGPKFISPEAKFPGLVTHSEGFVGFWIPSICALALGHFFDQQWLLQRLERLQLELCLAVGPSV